MTGACRRRTGRCERRKPVACIAPPRPPPPFADADFSAAISEMFHSLRPGGGCILTVRDYEREQRGRNIVSPYAARVPYCPDDNKIERVWLDLHANVTRNHRCGDMEGLMRNVIAYLVARNRRKRAELPNYAGDESRTVILGTKASLRSRRGPPRG